MTYKILKNYGAFKAGKVLKLRTIPTELLKNKVLKEVTPKGKGKKSKKN